LANSLGFGLALLEGVLVLELASHFGGVVGMMINGLLLHASPLSDVCARMAGGVLAFGL